MGEGGRGAPFSINVFKEQQTDGEISPGRDFKSETVASSAKNPLQKSTYNSFFCSSLLLFYIKKKEKKRSCLFFIVRSSSFVDISLEEMSHIYF